MRIISMLFCLLVISVNAMALGKIAGKVTDEKSGETIIGATVVVKGTGNGATTDVDGNFTLNVAAGTYTIEVKYIGYQGKEIADIKVTGNATTTVNVVLAEATSTTLNEVVVRSTVQKENITALYTIQKNNAAVSDGISADVIKKSPDRNTGEVLKRVSGTTVQDGKYVVVRGLSDRYNTAMLDNAVLPSTEANRKVFSFDIIPASLIDNIVISKSATPDLPGDFAGGVINILTKEIPDQDFFNVSLGAGYNTAATFKEFKTGYKSGTDILGFDDGSRQLPTDGAFPADDDGVEKLHSQFINTINKNKQPTIDALSQFNNDYSITDRKAMPNMNLQASGGKSWKSKKGNKFGVIAGLTYGHSETYNEDFIRQYKFYNYKDNSYKYSSSIGGLVNLGYSFGSSKISLKTLYNRVFDDNFLYREGYDYSKSTDIRFYAYDLVQKSLFKTSLEGDHQVGKGQSKLNWNLAYNKVGNNQPDQRKVIYNFSETLNNYAIDLSSLSKSNSRLFADLNEDIYQANVNFTQPFKLGNIKSTVKAGGYAQYRSRTFDARFLGMIATTEADKIDEVQALQVKPVDQVFTQENINNGLLSMDEVTLPSDKYDATATTLAGYAMLDNKFTDKLRLVWGARVENYNIVLNSTTPAGKPLVIDSTWLDVLPSVNFTYALTEKSNLRASYYRTVARPELREMAPFSYFDYEMSALQNGNVNLRRSQIDNVDLRYEVYPNAGEILSASVFYKHFKNPLEMLVMDAASSLETQIYNFTEANNIGVEAEIRKNLGFIKPLKNFNFYANLAYIKSTVSDSAVGISIPGLKERPLSGQSNYVINTGIGYTGLDGKLSLNVLYNRIGQRIFLVGGTLFGNVWEAPRNLLDFQASYNLSKRSEIRLNIKDILNAKYRYYIDQNGNSKFDGVQITEKELNTAGDMILQQYRPGTTFSLTYSYRL